METHDAESFDLAAACSEIDWDDPRRSSRQTRKLLGRLAADRELLTDLLVGIESDPLRLGRSERHPLMHRLSLYEDPERRCQLRLHFFTGRDRDLVPHDHKYPFSVHVLSGGYLHVWNRRTDEAQIGDFTSEDVTPGIVTLERPGTSYSFQNSLVHQTIVLPGTVSLFLRGPKRQDRWHAAKDMLHLLNGYEAPSEGKKTHLGAEPITTDEFLVIRDDLARRGIITDRRPSGVAA
ncbi:hypothetical protein EH183_30600 [Streptomyces sp. CB01881]|nr:hypothetical protein C2142_30535 [Streptomyces sp. CB01881]TYC70835.1 hypothetical protein EH183_30600 [Streptomyces sp. CB01881]